MEIHESDVGRIVQHRLTHEKVMIVFVYFLPGYRCIRIRRPDYTIVEVFQEELEEESE